DRVLAIPSPYLTYKVEYPRAIWHYTRGWAFLRTGLVGDARASRDSVYAIARAASPADSVVNNSTRDLLSIAGAILSGEILAAALATYGRDIYGAVFGWQLPLAFQALAIVSALVECFMVFGLWLPRLRRLAFVTGALFHLSIEAILPVRVFSFAMIAAYTLFLPAARLEVFVRARRERFLLTTVCGVLAAFAIHASLAWLLQNVSTPRRPQFALFLALGIFFGAVIAFPRWAAPSTGGRALVPVSLRVPLFTGLVLLQLWGALKPLFGYTNRFGWKMFTEVTRVGGAIEIERGGGWSEYEQSTWGNKLKPIWDSLSEQRDLMLGSAERVLADEPEATRARVRLRYEQNGERGEELIEVGR
ncbi:MAG: hypothetical protein ABW217_10580, partial [Polyangiaceae bacterium]